MSFIQHTFRWGVGNKFRSQSINRLRPTHIERLTITSIPSDYFINDRKNVQYNEVNEHWEVFWHENGKLNGKPFPIRKFGVLESKKLAYEFADTIENNSVDNSNEQSDFDNSKSFYFDRILQCWVALYWKGSRPCTSAFSVNIHGYDKAKNMAMRVSGQNNNKID